MLCRACKKEIDSSVYMRIIDDSDKYVADEHVNCWLDRKNPAQQKSMELVE